MKIGPNDAHKRICHHILWDSLGQEIDLIFKKDLHCSRIFGYILIIQNIIRIAQEIFFQTCWFIDINTVDALSKKVNKIIDIINDNIIVIILL